jgi:hypothetical protein
LLEFRYGRTAALVAPPSKHQKNAVLLNQLADQFDRLGGIVGIIIGDEPDPTAVDAPFGVHLVEVSRKGLADHAVSGSRSAVGHDIADLDFGIGGAGVVFLLCQCAAAGRGKQCEGSRNGSQSQVDNGHFDLPRIRMDVSSSF